MGPCVRSQFTHAWRGRLHFFERLGPARTAFVVIDMQGTFCEPSAPTEVPLARAIIDPISRLAAGLRSRGGRVVWITHANNSIGAGSDWQGLFEHFVADEVRARTAASLSPEGHSQKVWEGPDRDPGDLHLLKNRYSALIPGSSNLERVLRSAGTTHLLIAGTKTNISCGSTARNAMMMDVGVVMVSYACDALSDDEHRATLETVMQNLGNVMTIDEVLGCLGSPAETWARRAAGIS